MPVSQLPKLIYIFIIFVYVPHTLYTQSPPLASVHILYHIACRLHVGIRVMTVCTSATVATLIISCRLTAPCGHSHYDSLHKCNCRNAHYIMSPNGSMWTFALWQSAQVQLSQRSLYHKKTAPKHSLFIFMHLFCIILQTGNCTDSCRSRPLQAVTRDFPVR